MIFTWGHALSCWNSFATYILAVFDPLLSILVRNPGIVANQGRVILAIDGMQPEIGHEVLWVIRDCIGSNYALNCKNTTKPELNSIDFAETPRLTWLI
ncbi:hypothetical protein [Nostoc sp. C117]|uniref:hypothetical protein n=1 Tax=Nostoc sp. C117 TaxID=3349875 RepID=UPI00370D2A43